MPGSRYLEKSNNLFFLYSLGKPEMAKNSALNYKRSGIKINTIVMRDTSRCTIFVRGFPCYEQIILVYTQYCNIIFMYLLNDL